MPRERRRRFRGTLFVTTHEEYERLRVAVTRLPERGIPDGPAFVLVHGIGVSSRYFRPLASRLIDDGTVHLVDLPGYGAAPDPKRHVSLADHADAVAAFIRTLSAPEVVVVGHSMGAQVAVSLAQRHPELVSRIVLVGPTMEPSRRTAAQAIGRLLLDGTREPLAVNGIVFSDYVFRAGPAYTIRQLSLVLDDALEERVGGLSMPVVVVRGDRDPIVSGKWGRTLAARAAAPYVEVPGPHVVQYTNPDAVARAVWGAPAG
ncbi:alpha/beta fold hydrolase [Protaetiibacter sp. SSC-01]|uniref:alpha/beta fold hydrolase n=1 Tax=Protaetiibacter sp. SSC-01 TaxID=2759943 RepID=UPI0016575682|nr:alpha/beta hydrolase [Protaetiibacter sp. SSC-01]QNO36686.1 alpha/beta fold hydrolase [Protaetiibacter sp. SSC-01]